MWRCGAWRIALLVGLGLVAVGCGRQSDGEPAEIPIAFTTGDDEEGEIRLFDMVDAEPEE